MFLLLSGSSIDSALRALPFYGVEEAKQAMRTFSEEAAGGIEDAKISISDYNAEVYDPGNKAMLYWKIEEHDEIELKQEATEQVQDPHLVTIGITEADIDEVLAFYMLKPNEPLSNFVKERCIAAFDLKKDLLEDKLHGFIRTLFVSMKSVRYIFANGQGTLKVKTGSDGRFYYEWLDEDQKLIKTGLYDLGTNMAYIPRVAAAAEQIIEKLGISSKGARLVRY